MKIFVADVLSNKVLTFEVSPNITLGELIENIIETLKLPSDYMYSIVYGAKELGPDKYSYTLEELGIGDGDELQIVGRPQGG